MIKSILKLLIESTALSLYLWISLPALLLFSLFMLTCAVFAWVWYEICTLFKRVFNVSK